MVLQFEKFTNELYINCQINNILGGFVSNSSISNTDNNLQILIYSPETNFAYICNLTPENITIPNTNLESMYKMILKCLDMTNGYSIGWDLNNLNIVLTCEYEIFKFTQKINFVITDNQLAQIRYNMYNLNKKIESTTIKNDIPKVDIIYNPDKQTDIPEYEGYNNNDMFGQYSPINNCAPVDQCSPFIECTKNKPYISNFNTPMMNQQTTNPLPVFNFSSLTNQNPSYDLSDNPTVKKNSIQSLDDKYENEINKRFNLNF